MANINTKESHKNIREDLNYLKHDEMANGVDPYQTAHLAAV